VVRTGAGGTETISPTTVDVGTGTLTFPTDRFSTFMAVAPRGPPNIDGRAYWLMSVELELEAAPGPEHDSRARRILVSLGTVDFGPAGTPDSVTWEIDTREVRIDNPSVSVAPDLDEVRGSTTQTSKADVGSAGWSYDVARRAVVLDDAVSDLLLSEDGAVLIGSHGPTPGPSASLEVLLDRPAAPLDAKSLVGSYWVASVEFQNEAPGNSPAEIQLLRGFGEMTLKAGGTLTITVDSRKSFTSRNGTNEFSERQTFGGTWSTAGAADGRFEGSIVIEAGSPEVGGVAQLRFLPSADGRIVIGTDRGPGRDGAFLGVAVRKGSGMRASQLAGEWRSFAVGHEATTYDVDVAVPTAQVPNPPPNLVAVPDWILRSVSSRFAFDAAGGIQVLGELERRASRSLGLSPGGVLLEEEVNAGTPSATATLTGKGRFRIDPGPSGGGTGPNEIHVGAVSPDRRFGFILHDPNGPAGMFGLHFFVRRPPDAPAGPGKD
jgi:hypothetical protein